MMSDPIDDLVARAERYAARANLALATVSGKILNDGKRLDQLKRREVGCTVDRLQRASAKLTELENKLREEAS